MTTTARIALTTAGGTYAASIADASFGNFKAVGLGINETILVQTKNAAGTYDRLTWVDDGGTVRESLGVNNNSIRIAGPVDFNFVQPVTVGSAGLDQYS